MDGLCGEPYRHVQNCFELRLQGVCTVCVFVCVCVWGGEWLIRAGALSRNPPIARHHGIGSPLCIMGEGFLCEQEDILDSKHYLHVFWDATGNKVTN